MGVICWSDKKVALTMKWKECKCLIKEDLKQIGGVKFGIDF